MSKKVITADTIRSLHANGQTRLEVSIPQSIITPEAKEVAGQLGISVIINVGNQPAAAASPKATEQPLTPLSGLSAAELNSVREAVIAQLPKGVTISDALVEQLIAKALQNKPLCQCQPTTKSGIKVVKGNQVNLQIFEGAGKEKKVGIADAITAADNSSMASGYMAWENAAFPWTLTYDEVLVILEGELHIHCQGETNIAKTGDVMFIPKGSAIEFATPTKVRLVYVAWPANWQEQ